ncbi:hypothetical protein AVEN_229665-1 [Araneus ventricosus]|uniref:Uncharacterized protein n=1 Tax=Araneus ventricosus TaxID=182803 RepID=A0A4Y2ULH5_ARAVE|nr:hypothetical protein AVEN_229665-1 [Araneus ventricosus]
MTPPADRPCGLLILNRCLTFNDVVNLQVYLSADGLLPFITRLLCSVLCFLDVFFPDSCAECCNIPEEVFLSRQVFSRGNAMGLILHC